MEAQEPRTRKYKPGRAWPRNEPIFYFSNSTLWICNFYIFTLARSSFSVLLYSAGLSKDSLGLQSLALLSCNEHMIVSANQCNDGQEGRATTAFYTHTKCRWNQYTPTPPTTTSKKYLPTAFARFASTPISIQYAISGK